MRLVVRFLPTFLLSLAAVLSLSACTTTGTVPERVQSETADLPEDDPVTEQYNERIAAVAREVRAVCSAAVNQAYFSRTPCLPSGMHESHLRDRTRITAEQKKAAARVFEHLRRLNEETRTLMTESGNAELMTLARRSRESVDPKIHEIQSALISGSITWGEYNRSRLEIFEASTGFTPGEH